MNELFRVIGIIIFSITMYAIPILATLSFSYNWGTEFKASLFFLSMGQLLYIIVKYISKED